MITGRTANGIRSITAAAGSNRPQHQHGRAQQAENAAAAGKPASRALVPVSPSPSRADSQPKAVLNPARGSSAFLTQLIASELGVESMRARRRAAPDLAAAAYVASAVRPQAYRPQRRLGSL